MTAVVNAPMRLVDRFGRVARDLRVSVTDRCNLRCAYCMPAEGVSFRPKNEILTSSELIRLIKIAVEILGIEKICFTGGEPLLRKDLEEIIAEAANLRKKDGEKLEISMTTNGLGLAHRAKKLAEAGLQRVNISLDAANSHDYKILTRRDRFADAIAGAQAAHDAGLSPIKLNAVLLPGFNDHQAPDLVKLALKNGYTLRFIEFMPLGTAWERQKMITCEDILSKLREEFTLKMRPESERGSSPAKYWDVAAGDEHPAGKIGIIASVSRPFCGDCDRTRITADGQIRSCLFARSETDLRGLLRSGASDADIAGAWAENMWNKQPGHGIDDPSFLKPKRNMSAIGG